MSHKMSIAKSSIAWGKNAEFKVINRVPSGDLGERLAVGVGYQKPEPQSKGPEVQL